MYKTITTAIPAGQNFSPSVYVPGKAIGFVISTADAAASARVRIQTEAGLALLVNDQNNLVGIALGTNVTAYCVLPLMPIGGVHMQLGLTSAQLTPINVIVYYEDSPAVY